MPVTGQVICWFSPVPVLDLPHHCGLIWQSGLLTDPGYHHWTCYSHLAGVPWGCPFAGEVFALPALLSSLLPAPLHLWDIIGPCCSLVHVMYWIPGTSQITLCLDNRAGRLSTLGCTKSLSRCHCLLTKEEFVCPSKSAAGDIKPLGHLEWEWRLVMGNWKSLQCRMTRRSWSYSRLSLRMGRQDQM